MYSTCLFCHADLGRNTLIEAFPVGRRLAFDGGRGRLWVVCRKCERWNLTPLDERWEAIETAERLYRGTKVRVATEQVGLARFMDDKGPVELVRIGRPLRPELAAWRYGDQFGRRRTRHLLYLGGSVAAAGAVIVAGPVMGLISLGVASPILNLVNVANSVYSSRAIVRVPLGDATPSITMQRKHLATARLLSDGDDFKLTLTALRDRDPAVPWWKFDGRATEVTLRGMTAVRAAGAILPPHNSGGGSAKRVQEAVSLLERHDSPEHLFASVAKTRHEHWKRDAWQFGEAGALKSIPVAMRLALEMAAHEDSERRAMEGELALLEAAWRDAEAIANIADELGQRD